VSMCVHVCVYIQRSRGCKRKARQTVTKQRAFHRSPFDRKRWGNVCFNPVCSFTHLDRGRGSGRDETGTAKETGTGTERVREKVAVAESEIEIETQNHPHDFPSVIFPSDISHLENHVAFQV